MYHLHWVNTFKALWFIFATILGSWKINWKTPNLFHPHLFEVICPDKLWEKTTQSMLLRRQHFSLKHENNGAFYKTCTYILSRCFAYTSLHCEVLLVHIFHNPTWWYLHSFADVYIVYRTDQPVTVNFNTKEIYPHVLYFIWIYWNMTVSIAFSILNKVQWIKLSPNLH